MGWFYEVDIANQDIDDNDKLMVNGVAIVQGKNSTDDYEDYYMDRGKPLRYPNINALMPRTEGGPEDVRLLGSITGAGGKEQHIEYMPIFSNGEWWVKEVEADS